MSATVWVAKLDPLAENDVHVVARDGRLIAVFYREFDANGGIDTAWIRARRFIKSEAMQDALIKIKQADMLVFDDDDLKEWVEVTMDIDTASEIATGALR